MAGYGHDIIIFNSINFEYIQTIKEAHNNQITGSYFNEE